MIRMFLGLICWAVLGVNYVQAQCYTETDSSAWSLYAVKIFDTGEGFAGGFSLASPNYYGTLKRTADGGATWDSVDIGTTNWVLGMQFKSPQVGYIVGTGGMVRRTVDGGNSWVDLSVPVENSLQAVFFVNEQVGYVGGGNCLFGTMDGGESWDTLVYWVPPGPPYTDPPQLYVNDIWFFNDSTGVIGGSFTPAAGAIPPVAFLWKTTDYGHTVVDKLTWLDLNAVRKFQFKPDGREGIASLYDRFVKTKDYGETWTDYMLPNMLRNTGGFQFFNDMIGYSYMYYDSAGANTNLYETTNGGTAWQLRCAHDDGFYFLHDMSFTDRMHGCGVGEQYGVRGSALLYDFEGSGVLEHGGATGVGMVVPNPIHYTGRLVVSTLLRRGSFVLYSTLGKQILQQVGIQGNEVWIQRGHIPSGTYFYELTDEGRVVSRGKVVFD
jgi:photosystem II stability/assembly factor-like uncharacterized protein